MCNDRIFGLIASIEEAKNENNDGSFISITLSGKTLLGKSDKILVM